MLEPHAILEQAASLQVNLTIAPNGRVVIPASRRAVMGLQGGGKVVARLVNGAVVLEPIAASIQRAPG